MNVGSLPTNPTASDICSMVPFLERIGLGSTEREDKEKEGESEEDRKQKEMKEKIIQEYEAGKKKEKEDKITAARLQYEQNLVELQEYSKKADGIPPACLRNFELTAATATEGPSGTSVAAAAGASSSNSRPGYKLKIPGLPASMEKYVAKYMDLLQLVQASQNTPGLVRGNVPAPAQPPVEEKVAATPTVPAVAVITPAGVEPKTPVEGNPGGKHVRIMENIETPGSTSTPKIRKACSNCSSTSCTGCSSAASGTSDSGSAVPADSSQGVMDILAKQLNRKKDGRSSDSDISDGL